MKTFWEKLGADTTFMSEINERIRVQQLELRKKIIHAEEQGWTMITTSYSWDHIPKGWVEEYLTGKYICMGHYWYFEKPGDATFFALRWS